MINAIDLFSENGHTKQTLPAGMAFISSYLETLQDLNLTLEEKKASLDFLREISGNVAKTDVVHAKATAGSYSAFAVVLLEAMTRAESPAERQEIIDKALGALQATQCRIESQNQRSHATQENTMGLAAVLVGGAGLLALLAGGGYLHKRGGW
jgi:hypothetical protein